MARRTIKPSRRTRVLLPCPPDSQAARARRPTEILDPAQIPPPPQPPAASGPITIEMERAFAERPAVRNQRHQTLAAIAADRKAKRQTRNLAGRGWA